MRSIRILFLLISTLSISFANERVQPTINFSPVWVMAEYGWYWGASISGGVITNQHHTILGTVDLAPWGGMFMTDVSTNGEENHFGGTFAYQYKFRIADDFLKLSPGVVTGFASIPYIYGTMFEGPFDSTTSTISEPKPERETIWGVGPDLGMELGRKNLNFNIRGRVLFARDYNTALLTNIGVSYIF